MGLFSGGNSKRTTVNEDNRVINDFGGADLSNDIDNSQDNSVSGAYAGNSGNISVIDGGAIDLAAENISLMGGLASESFSLASESFSLADSLSTTMAEASSTMLGDSLAASGQVFNVAALSLDDSNARTIDAALSMGEMSAYQSQNNNDFALALSKQNGEAAIMQQQDNNNALENGFKSSMQFVEQFSRSDGASIAETTNKTIMVLAGASAAIYFINKKWS